MLIVARHQYMNESDEFTDAGTSSTHFQEFSLSYEPDFREILKGVLNVNKADARTYFALLQHQIADVGTVADEIGRSENTARRQLAKLRDAELVTRDTRVAKRGTHHTYQPLSLTQAKSMLNVAVDLWVLDAAFRIDHLTEDLTDESSDRRGKATTDSTPDGFDGFDASDVARRALGDEIPSLRSVATCGFGFAYPELELYLVLLNHPRSTAQELATERDLARTTVVGRLNALQDRGLARPEPRETEVGNRIAYEYVPRPLDEVKEAMIEQLHEKWIAHAHDCIDEFDPSSVEYRD